MAYSEFLETFYDISTSSNINPLPSSTASTCNKKSRDLRNSIETYKEYLKEEQKIKKSYEKYLKKKNERFWRKKR